MNKLDKRYSITGLQWALQTRCKSYFHPTIPKANIFYRKCVNLLRHITINYFKLCMDNLSLDPYIKDIVSKYAYEFHHQEYFISPHTNRQIETITVLYDGRIVESGDHIVIWSSDLKDQISLEGKMLGTIKDKLFIQDNSTIHIYNLTSQEYEPDCEGVYPIIRISCFTNTKIVIYIEGCITVLDVQGHIIDTIIQSISILVMWNDKIITCTQNTINVGITLNDEIHQLVVHKDMLVTSSVERVIQGRNLNGERMFTLYSYINIDHFCINKEIWIIACTYPLQDDGLLIIRNLNDPSKNISKEYFRNRPYRIKKFTSNLFIILMTQGSPIIMNIENQEQYTLEDYMQGISCVEVNPLGGVVTASRDGTIIVWK